MPAIHPKAKLKSWQGRAEVTSIHDGDTFNVMVDLGFGVLKRCPVRVEGINAPELPSAAGLNATAYLQTLIRPGDVVTLDSRRLDLHGRAQAVVLLADGRDIATEMIAAGHAQPADKAGKT
jgi:endonuclease YncB( thermonuclease family)